jgi:ketosteroid isomerase-like protein
MRASYHPRTGPSPYKRVMTIYKNLATLCLAGIGFSTAQTSDEAFVRQAEKDWNGAIAAKDGTAAVKFMADDYISAGVRLIGPSTADRQTWLQSLVAMRVFSYQTEVTRVRIYGGSAVVNVKGSWHVSFQGQEVDENFFATDVWNKRADGWKVVLRHSSPYPHQ